MVKYLYNLVMDPEHNPLKALPKMVRFQYMVILAYMWSVVFPSISGRSLYWVHRSQRTRSC
jgi:hypothetical protein